MEIQTKLNKTFLHENISKVLEKIKALSPHAKLIAVTKTQPEEVIELYCEVAKELNFEPIFGENYLQEIIQKKKSFANCELHFIGRLQSNKIKDLLSLTSVIESVASLSHIQEINKQKTKLGIIPKVFLQVNVSKDPKKAGLLPHEIEGCLKEVTPLGLMTILEDNLDDSQISECYRSLRTLRDSIDPSMSLSMGMSGDYEIALKEGATHIRIGSALFGIR